MSDINTPLDEELDATDNGTEAVEASHEASATEAPVAEASKSVSLDDALAKAFEKHTSVAEDNKAKPAVAETPAPTPEEKPVDPITGRVMEPMKAPAGWTPLLKEKWGAVDPTVQKFIHDREKDMAQTISKTADERKLANEFKDIVSPYESTIRGFNVPATSIVKDLMTQWHAMTTGDGVTKARIFVNLLNHYKPDANALQQMLAGQNVQAPQPAPDVQAEIDKALALREERAQQAAIGSDIEKFAKDPANEFFETVRDSMGRIVTAELVQADTMPELFKKAYDLACSQHPEISQILEDRAAAAAPSVAASPIAKPVGSVKPSLGSGQKSKAPVKSISLDDAIAQAMRQHT